MAGAMKRVGLVAVAALLLSGCEMYSLAKLRQTTPKGSLFQSALSKLYMDFAAEEEKEYDWFNSWHFADKGLMLAYGRDAGPEDLAGWNIPADALPYLQKGREALLAVLTPQNEKDNPSVAAKAQFNFDCWVEQQEEDWQFDDITACREGLREALAELGAPPIALTPGEEQEVVQQAAQAQAAIQEEAPAKKAKPRKSRLATKKAAAHPAKVEEKAKAPARMEAAEPETTSYVVFFEASTAELSPSGEKVIEDVAHSLSGAKDYDIVINGNTGAESDVAQRLSQSRVASVREALVDAGIPEAAISAGDNAKERASRRVEIFLNE